MRYSIRGTTAEQISSMGVTNIVDAPHVGFVWADLTPNQISALKAMGCEIREIVQVKAQEIGIPTPMEAVGTWSTSQVLEILGLDEIIQMMDPPLTGKGLTVAVLDTGIRTTHETIAGRVVYSQNFTSGSNDDVFDHGTGIASIIVALASECQVLNFKVLDDDGNGSDETVIAAIEKCLELWEEDPDMAPMAVNMSLGAPDNGDVDSPIRVACRAMIEKGLFVIAAAGNSGPDPNTILSPACEQYVFCIGCVNFEPPEQFTISQFSSRGPTLEGLIKPDAVLVGQDLILASSASDSAMVAKSGTSFSAPWASAMLLLYWDGVVRGYQLQPGASLPPGMDPALWATPLLTVTNREALDKWLVASCLNPEHFDSEGKRISYASDKDNNYGYGIPFGPLMGEVFGEGEAQVGTSSLMAMIPMMIAMVMMASMSKVFTQRDFRGVDLWR